MTGGREQPNPFAPIPPDRPSMPTRLRIGNVWLVRRLWRALPLDAALESGSSRLAAKMRPGARSPHARPTSAV
jgi:hypothetical protein